MDTERVQRLNKAIANIGNEGILKDILKELVSMSQDLDAVDSFARQRLELPEEKLLLKLVDMFYSNSQRIYRVELNVSQIQLKLSEIVHKTLLSTVTSFRRSLLDLASKFVHSRDEVNDERGG